MLKLMNNNQHKKKMRIKMYKIYVFMIYFKKILKVKILESRNKIFKLLINVIVK